MEIDLDISDVTAAVERWDRAVVRIGEGLEDAVRASAKAGEAAAKVHAPHRSYTLRDSIAGIVTESGTMHAEGAIIAGADYAAAVNDGQKAHPIEAKNAQALRFEVGGQTVFRKRVNHPAVPANPFMKHGEDAADQKLPAAVDTLIATALGD